MADDGTLLDLLRRGQAWLAERGVAHARREAEWIFAHALGRTRLELYTGFDMPVSEDERRRLRSLVTRRGAREPLAYLLGSQPFHDLDLAVDGRVLVPRPETEELVERILAQYDRSPMRVLDIGTGSGAIALALAKARPDWEVHATDVSAAALEVARGNADRHGLAVAFHHGDLAAGAPGRFDLVVSNPPYIAEDERHLCDPELAHEPAQALFAGADGLAVIGRLLAGLDHVLAPAGAAWIEHGFRQATAIAAVARSHRLVARAERDGAGHERFTVCRRGG